MIELLLSGKKRAIKTSWLDFTVGDIQRVYKHQQESAEEWSLSFLYRFAIYNDIPLDEMIQWDQAQLLGHSTDAVSYERLESLTAFEKASYMDFVKPLPNALQFFVEQTSKTKKAADKVRVPKYTSQIFPVPFYLGEKKMGARILYEQVVIPSVRMHNDNLIPSIHQALGILFQTTIYSASFNESQVNQLCEEAMMCNFADAYPVAAFFFERWKRSYFETRKTSNTNRPKKREKPASKSYSKTLATTTI